MYRQWNEEDHKHEWIANTWYDKVVVVIGWATAIWWIVWIVVAFVATMLAGV